MAKQVKPEMIYMDTGALIAFFNTKDENHAKAVAFFKESVTKGIRFVVGRPVLMEFLNGTSKRVGKRTALELKNIILSSEFIIIENETEEDWNKAWKIFEKFEDYDGMDLVDCLSFAIMERLRIITAFTFDHDFEIYGFYRVP
ncbi:type II toxin-antitoxin system VapC family toxin [Pyrococcus kukulkanii]|uniref:type II toxin-antitoxin system VapC family toxin n=1 Tax=Pyrococcus kukulkanii TaxID=1609559 RepID=UPI003563B8B6